MKGNVSKQNHLDPEERARVKIDRQLNRAGWDVVDRPDYVPGHSLAVREGLMQGNKRSDYLFFVDDKAIAVLEAKRAENNLGDAVAEQAERYCAHPQSWYGLWFKGQIPLVYMSNGEKLYFKNLLDPDSDYEPLREMHTPKEMLRLIGKTSKFGALPRIDKKGLRDCQYRAEAAFEDALRAGRKRSLAVLATGSGKTYLACLAAYRLLNYTDTRRILFLVDRNNLARQTESEFNLFDRTEKKEPMSHLYKISRIRREEDAQSTICISTIQKLYALLTGKALIDTDEDEEDEKLAKEPEVTYEKIVLGDDLKLAPDHFQFIIVDECHRSIYGKWRAVLDYFSGAVVLGLTATPTPDAYTFFNDNLIEKYTYQNSVDDGVNVPSRIYRIKTKVTQEGGTIEKGKPFVETTLTKDKGASRSLEEDVAYSPNNLDRAIVNTEQIKTVLVAYRDAIYTNLYPDRDPQWAYIPKTLIFAKNDYHATQIVDIAKKVFGAKFPDRVPEGFVQKITYSAGDSNALIRAFRTERAFRIAVTVTLVATGTDIKPLEVVMFMKNVGSDTLYTQMKGRGCRTISRDQLREVTPNAEGKDFFYIVDAVGATEREHYIPKPAKGGNKYLTLEELLEHLAHNELSDENLALLHDYCARIHNNYLDNPLFGIHLKEFTDQFGYGPKDIAEGITSAFDSSNLPIYKGPSEDNTARRNVIMPFIADLDARDKLIELKHGYRATTDDDDHVLYSGFSQETAKTYIENFEKYLNDHKDSVEALRILYNSEDVQITHAMLVDLRERLLNADPQFRVDQIWENYRVLDTKGAVDKLDGGKENANLLTNLIQIVRYAYKKTPKLTSIIKGYSRGMNLYYGQQQRTLTEDQKQVMQQIADYVIRQGALSPKDLNEFDTDLWRRGIKQFGKVTVLKDEMDTLAKFILKVA